MKIARVRVAQYLYKYADNRSDEWLQLEPGDVILYQDDSSCTFKKDDDASVASGETLRSWLVIYGGIVGWISSWDESPKGISAVEEIQ